MLFCTLECRVEIFVNDNTYILQIEKVLEMKKLFLYPVPFWSVAISARKINLRIDIKQEVSLSHISE